MSSFSAMLLLALCALLAPSALARGVSVVADSDSPMADRLTAEIENFRALMPTGAPAYGIPALEPLTQDRIPINIDSSQLTAVGSLNDLVVNGLSTFTVTKLVQTSSTGTNSGRVSLAISFPTLSATATYDLKGKLKLGLIPIKIDGSSPVSVTATGVTASADIDMTINDDDSVTIDAISNVDFDSKKINVKIDKMNSVVNSLINRLIPNVIKANRGQIAELVETKGKDNLNKYFDMIAGKTTPAPATAVFTKLTASPLYISNIIFSKEAQRILKQIALNL